MKFAPIFMKFGTYNKSNMLIIILIHTSVESAGVIEKMIICSEWLQVAKFDPQQNMIINCLNITLKVIKVWD